MSRPGIRRRYYVLGFFILLIVAYLLFANTIIKSIVEAKMGEAYGAEVTIGSLDHSLYPTAVTLSDIGLTNPTKPSHNQVFVGTASADVELIPLLSDRVVVDKLSLLDVQFDTERESPGEVYRVPKKSLTFDDVKQKAKGAVPSVDELLERNPLQTTAAVKNAQQAYSDYAGTLKDDYAALPDDERLDYYKTQIKALKEANYKDPQALMKAKETLSALKKEMRTDKEKISAFTDKAQSAKAALADSVEALKRAPKEDYALMKGIIAGDQAAMQEVTQFVFGDKAAEYTQYLTSAIQVVLPLIRGEDKPDEPATELPSILVRQADVSVRWRNETITSKWNNITNTHPLIGEPTTFTINAAGEMLNTFTSSGQFFIDSDGVDASQSWEIGALNMANIALSNNDKLTAVLKQALLETTGSLTVKNNQLSGSGNIDLRSLVMQATGSGNVTQAIAKALESLGSLSMSMLFDGTLDNPGFSVKSDLDNQLARAAVSQLTASQQDKLDKVNQKLKAMVNQPQDVASEQLGAVESMLTAAQGDNDALSGLLDTQLSGLVDKEKDKLLDKLKNKFGQQ